MKRRTSPLAQNRDLPPGIGESLEGILERFVFHNEEDGWSVVRLSVQGRREPVTAVGSFLGVQPGESLRLEGRWVEDRKWGRQFKAESFRSVKPATLVGIEKYLGSGMVRGVGKVMAGRLVKHFGAETLEVIDKRWRRLTEVPGIGDVRAKRIRKAWEEQREIKDVMIFLQSHGISTTFAIRIYRHYGAGAVKMVSENPYRLATDIFGIGFKSADAIAARLGIPNTSPRRAEAGVLYQLGKASDDGHVFLPRRELVDAARELLEVKKEIVERAVDQLAEEEKVVVEPARGGGGVNVGTDADGYAGGDTGGEGGRDAGSVDAVYLKSLHVCESGAAALLRTLAATPPAPLKIDTDRALAWFEDRQAIELAERQREAVRNALTGKVLVITGGPGTGKTTLVKAVIRILEKKGRRIQLAAPTGRAAKRMEEATGREARTIHRLLEFAPHRRSFERDQDRPLELDLLIVDEISMVDTALFYHVLKALPPPAQLVLVGDVDQLPSVGPGNVLGDLIRSGAVPVARLTEIFRQARESLIVVSAHRVNQGKMPEMKAPPAGADFFFIARDEPEEALETIKELVAKRIPDGFGFDPVDEIQVLTPMHRGILGAANLNRELQELLNPGGTPVREGGRSFRTGDKVMQVRNNYDLGVFNGDIGRVVGADEKEREVSVRYDENVVRYDGLDLDELTLSYACSIHKSQGSEYPAVVIPLHTQHYLMLQRNLLYTGITRGKRLVVLVGSRRAVALAVRNDRIRRRYTRLAHRLADRTTAGRV